jgi:hypothetical protein
MKTSPALILQFWERCLALDSKLIPFSDLHWTQSTHPGVSSDLRVPFGSFKRWFMENKRYWVHEWTRVGETVCMCGSFLTRILVFAGVQWAVLLVESGRGLVWTGGPWDSPTQPLGSLTGSRDWSRMGLTY